MTLLIPAVGAFGLLLAVLGVPPLRRRKLNPRIAPYLGGLQGRPSRLLHVESDSRRARLGRAAERLLGRLGVHPGRGLPARLEAAGLDVEPGEFRLEQLTWGAGAVILLGTIATLAWAGRLDWDGRALPPLVVLSFYLGWLGRDWLLTRQAETRRARLEEELPGAIDLVTLSIMAGESVPAAFARAGAILPTGVGEELRRVVADVRAGSSIVEALEELRRRVPSASVARFLEALITGIERGSPLADVLRAQADDGREAARRRLLEMGGRREVLMLVPVVFLIMPVIVVFALFPGLVSLNLLVP